MYVVTNKKDGFIEWTVKKKLKLHHLIWFKKTFFLIKKIS